MWQNLSPQPARIVLLMPLTRIVGSDRQEQRHVLAGLRFCKTIRKISIICQDNEIFMKNRKIKGIRIEIIFA